MQSFQRSTIPSELKRLNQWVCWCFERSKKGKLTKVPYQPNGQKADTTDPTTWSSLDKVINAQRGWRNKFGKPFDGIGFVFNGDFTGIDCDHCIAPDGSIDQWALDILRQIGSFADKSPNDGIHIFVEAVLSPDSRHKFPLKGMRHEEAAVEMYSSGRFFTWTGNHVEGTPETIEPHQTELNTLYHELLARIQKPSAEKSQKQPIHFNLSDSQLIEKACNASNGTAFAALWRGDISGYPSQSEADQALCNHLAFWTGKDAARIDSLFRRSALFREKWDRNARSGETYGEGTIREAIASCRETYATREPWSSTTPYSPQQDNSSNGNGHKAEQKIEITSEQLCSFTDDDAGNGDAMEALFGQDFLYCPARGWFHHVTTHWDLDPDGAEVKKKAVATLRTRRHAAVDLEREAIVKCTKGEDKRVNGCINRFRSLVNVSIDKFDNDPNVINCQNGVVNLQTGEITPHNREQRFTYCLPVAFRPGAFLQEWIDYLHGVVGGGQEVIDYLQLSAGYSLTGHTREEVLFYLFGPPRSGKGTYAEVFMRLIPDPISTMVDFNSFTAKREGDVSNFDLAPLKPSRMVFASESQKSQSLNPAKIKQLTGGDQVRASFKHKDFFSYRPQFKVWMMSNHSVNGDPEDDALWGRVRVIEFPNSYLGNEDKTKKERLKQPDALEAILAWAVEGAIKWYALGASGLQAPKAVTNITKKHRDELDYVQQWIEECCEEYEGVWSSSEEVTDSYTTWCKNNNVSYIKNPKELTQSLKARGLTTGVQKKIDGKNKRGVDGLYVYPVPDDSEKGSR